jgi:hypothetical protein
MSSPKPQSFQAHIRQAGNRPRTRNAARQEARRALGSWPKVQLRSV